MQVEHPQSLIYTNSDGDKCVLSTHAISLLITHIQNTRKKPEAGGILLGRFLLDSNDVIIDTITKPLNRDRRSRYRFFRSTVGHQQIADQEWQNSNGTTNYLGEWHTHPEPNPSPSSLDLRNWQNILCKSQFDSNSMFFVIVGITAIAIWQGYKQPLRFEKLTRAEGRTKVEI